MAKKKQYPVLCSWCEKKGIRTVVGMADRPGSHGVCSKCEEDFKRDLEKALNKKKGKNDR